MTETKNQSTENGGVTVSMSKLVEGIGGIFAGVLTMLDALDARTAKTLVSSYAQQENAEVQSGDSDAAPRPDEQEGKAGDTHAAEVANGSADSIPDSSGDNDHRNDGGSSQVAGQDTADAQEDSHAESEGSDATPGITVDDVAKIVVQKVRSNPGINDKIRALVNTHGAKRVTELDPSVLEAFLTDLSQL